MYREFRATRSLRNALGVGSGSVSVSGGGALLTFFVPFGDSGFDLYSLSLRS